MNLKQLRKEHNLTLKELSNELGLSPQVLSRYELDQTQPDFDTLIKIADYFQVSLDYLLGRESTYSIKTADNQFALNYGSLFDDDNFKRYVKVYSLLDTMQRMLLFSYVLGFVGQFGISNKDIS